ncbi:MAG: hypothetical protein E7632_14190 [Ruminococcaceae bacterium]|nr:hypothetical protein [Oscillospiraceae bacterium]
MKKTRLIAMAAACALSITASALLVSGNEPGYDAAGDPLVSLSYITEILTPAYDAKIAEMEKKVNAFSMQMSAQAAEITQLKAENAALKEEIANREAEAAEGWQVIYLEQGAKLLAKSPMEVILRTGTAIVVSITSNGINDITDGTELYNAVEVPTFHCLLVPRGDDGRGIQVTSEGAYIMVRGEHEIVK